ncbi:MAG: zinc-binding dehydrogenase [Candidatus Marinimicrobia bacterium]|nr:zinc-binding dehydrogenase [Candidatus Neomarinimicrobiota bacterium]
MIKTKAALIQSLNQGFQISQVELAPPKENEILIKVHAVGVCHSDWHLVTGDTDHALPCVPGHEGCGEIVELGRDCRGLKTGQKVILNWAPNCGDCFYCQKARPSLCEVYTKHIWEGFLMDGTSRLSLNEKPVYHYCGLSCLSEYAVVPASSCVVIPHDISSEIGALVGCAVTTGVGAALNTVQVSRGDSVVVFGAGGVGLSTIMGAAYTGADKIIAVDVHADKADVAIQCGATDFILYHNKIVDEIRSVTNGRGTDYVFEAIGNPAVQEIALAAVRPGGTLVLSGISPMGTTSNFSGAVLTRQEKTVKGSYYGTSESSRDFLKYITLYEKGELPIEKMIKRYYSLNEVNEAYQHLISGKPGRGVIQI